MSKTLKQTGRKILCVRRHKAFIKKAKTGGFYHLVLKQRERLRNASELSEIRNRKSLNDNCLVQQNSKQAILQNYMETVLEISKMSNKHPESTKVLTGYLVKLGEFIEEINP